MSVSDNSPQHGPGRGHKLDLAALKYEYERGNMGLRPLCKRFGVSYSTVSQRAMREKWVQRARLVGKASKEIEAKLDLAVKAKVEAELAPWIEQEKVKFTKEGHKLAVSGVTRVKRFFRANRRIEAKSESMIAKAASEYHRIGRVALGMGDGSPLGGSVNLNILTNQAAVEIAPNP